MKYCEFIPATEPGEALSWQYRNPDLLDVAELEAMRQELSTLRTMFAKPPRGKWLSIIDDALAHVDSNLAGLTEDF